MDMRTVIVIGNGFDIDLGWHTSYKDFCQSMKSKWNTLLTKEDCLYNYVINHVGENWFDLERTIYDYCLKKSTENTPKDLIDNDLEDFKSLKQELINFVSNRCKSPVSRNSCAFHLLNNYMEKLNQRSLPNDMIPKLYSFNYTPLEKVARIISPNANFNYYPVHGTIENNNCIFGFLDDNKIKGKYRYIQKAMDDTYAPPSLKPALMDASKIIIFGVSMGFIDSVYFKDVFERAALGGDYNTRKNFNITFVTYDEESKMNIKMNLQDIGISIQSLMTNNNIKFLLTSEVPDLKDFDNL